MQHSYIPEETVDSLIAKTKKYFPEASAIMGKDTLWRIFRTSKPEPLEQPLSTHKDLFEAWNLASEQAPNKDIVTFSMNELFDFGVALHKLRQGDAVARRSWGNKGIFLVYVPSSDIVVQENRPLAKLLDVGTALKYHAHIDILTNNGLMVPWCISQTDVLAKDWQLVKREI